MKEELIAFIMANDNPRYGTHNGYVAVPPSNRWHGESDMKQRGVKLSALPVHGGITFDGPSFGIDSSFKGIEFLTDHDHVPDSWWVIGFDTCQLEDNPTTWNKTQVKAETLWLKTLLGGL